MRRRRSNTNWLKRTMETLLSIRLNGSMKTHKRLRKLIWRRLLRKIGKRMSIKLHSRTIYGAQVSWKERDNWVISLN